jgi:arylsulfatase A-like enzyme
MSFHAHLSRRNLLAGAAGTLAFATAGRVAAQAGKPNIVFILADDLGFADVSCYGQRDYTTPNIDRLALEGMRFTQPYSNSPDCSATRTALISGRRWSANGTLASCRISARSRAATTTSSEYTVAVPTILITGLTPHAVATTHTSSMRKRCRSNGTVT